MVAIVVAPRGFHKAFVAHMATVLCVVFTSFSMINKHFCNETTVAIIVAPRGLHKALVAPMATVLCVVFTIFYSMHINMQQFCLPSIFK